MTAPDGECDVILDDERWSSALGDVEALVLDCRRAAASFDPKTGGAAAFLFADDETLQDLNKRFRGFDKPTNVLSFPSGGDFLGDVAIAYETCRREAEEEKIAFRDHAAHLIVHGLLHLAGYDHEKDEDAERMEPLETRILAAMGIADPYGDR